jgi:hypothetical protein
MRAGDTEAALFGALRDAVTREAPDSRPLHPETYEALDRAAEYLEGRSASRKVRWSPELIMVVGILALVAAWLGFLAWWMLALLAVVAR